MYYIAEGLRNQKLVNQLIRGAFFKQKQYILYWLIQEIPHHSYFIAVNTFDSEGLNQNTLGHLFAAM